MRGGPEGDWRGEAQLWSVGPWRSRHRLPTSQSRGGRLHKGASASLPLPLTRPPLVQMGPGSRIPVRETRWMPSAP